MDSHPLYKGRSQHCINPLLFLQKGFMASKWFNVHHVAADYTFPLEDRPGKFPFPTCQTIPVIDLEKSRRDETIHQILEAGQRYGFFQVINHGISEDVVNDLFGVFREYFDMPAEEKQCAPEGGGWIYMGSTDYAKDGVHLWRENIKHYCYPLEESMQSWPQKPTRYREIVATYLKKLQALSSRILELIGEGLGLEAEYLKQISQVQLLVGNYYPPCPDPSLTLGLLNHCDPSLITILLQEDVCGLQVLNDGQWLGVSAVPNAFVVNIGNQLQIISNGKLKSAEHRAVTNPERSRMSIATFINPSPNCIVEPAEALVDELNPPLYKPTLYKDFVYSSKAFGPHTEAIQKPTGANA